MTIKATPIKAKDLKPGDLFSTAGQTEWDAFFAVHPNAVGQKVYFRTNAPTPPDQAEDVIYLITIEKEKPCDYCEGLGRRTVSVEGEHGGAGEIEQEICSKCNGSGFENPLSSKK